MADNAQTLREDVPLERLGLPERGLFQGFLTHYVLGIERTNYKTQEDFEVDLNLLSKKYNSFVTKIIDSPINHKLRELITIGYKEYKDKNLNYDNLSSDQNLVKIFTKASIFVLKMVKSRLELKKSENTEAISKLDQVLDKFEKLGEFGELGDKTEEESKESRLVYH